MLVSRDNQQMILITFTSHVTDVLMAYSGRYCNSFALDLQHKSIVCDIHLATPSSPVKPVLRPPRMIDRRLDLNLSARCLVATHT